MKTTLSIPNPCSEDWSKMTPTEKGAYCDKCQFEVIDFTAMEPEEIKATLKAQAGKKTCGHVSKIQLEMINSDYHLWENQTVSIFRSKFLYACLMVFGFTLFASCGDRYTDEQEIGKIEPAGMVEEELLDGMMDAHLDEIDTTVEELFYDIEE